MVTENNVWRMNLKYCAWRLILKHFIWHVILKCCAWRLVLKSDRRNVLKSGVRGYIMQINCCKVLFRSSMPIKKLADVLNSPIKKNDWISSRPVLILAEKTELADKKRARRLSTWADLKVIDIDNILRIQGAKLRKIIGFSFGKPPLKLAFLSFQKTLGKPCAC